MINALGLLEVRGLTASIAAADAMLKAAQVRILNTTVTPSSMVTLIIEGDLAACRAALDAGTAAASQLGQVIARKEIGRPEKDTEWFALHLTKTNQSSSNIDDQKRNLVIKKQQDHSSNIVKKGDITHNNVQKVQQLPVVLKQAKNDGNKNSIELNEQTSTHITEVKPIFSEEALITLIHNNLTGCNMTDLINHFKVARLQIKSKLTQGISKGMLQKKGNRYVSIIKDK